MKKTEAISILATSVRPREPKDRARYDEAVKMAIEALKSSEQAAEIAQNVQDEDLISKLSEIRSNYTCFSADEEPYYRALSEAIRILSQRSDGDTISRQAAIDCVTYDEEYTIECLKALSSAQPERPKGHWIVWGGMDIPENHGKHKCSLCGEFAPVRYEKPLIKENLSNFCPECGADMRGEQDEHID